MRARKYTYIPNAEIESITTWNGKEIPGSKLLDGAYARGKVQYGDGGTMAEGGEIRIFDRHQQMDSETRGEILDTINEFYLIEGFKNLQNYLYGLFDGYDYSQTDSFKNSMRKLKKTREKGLYDRIQRIYDKIDQYSFEQMARGGMMAKGGKVEIIVHGKSREYSLGTFESGASAKRYIEESDLKQPYTLKKIADGGMMAKGGYASRHRKRTLEEKAQEMYGSDWFDLDERTRKELIDDLRITKGAKGLIVGDKYVATFTLDNGKAITKTYNTKDELDEGIGEMYSDYDVIDVKIEETKVKEVKEEPKEEKKGIFKLAKITEKTTSKGKEKRQGVAIEGIESDISRYEELKAIMKNSKAESDLIGGRIKELGFQKWLELYEQNGTNPNSIDLIDGDETIMLQVKDAYKKVIPEKKVILQENYPDLIETTIVFNLNPTLLDKYGEVITNLINNSKDIEEKDKENLIKGESTTIIKSGSVDKILNYPNPEEVFILIEPTIALF